MHNISGARGLRLLSFDGGGERSLSQLVILKEIMDQLRSKKYPHDEKNVILPCQEFDMIGGSDTGGLLALMFTKLQMSVGEATDEFCHIIEKVYKPRFSDRRQRTKVLREYLMGMLERNGRRIDSRLDGDWEEGYCAGFCIAIPSVEIRHHVCLRSYISPQGLPSSITIIDAMLATCASNPIFELVTSNVGFEEQTFVGASLGVNNPFGILITEAHMLYGGQTKVASGLSLGSGNTGILTLPTRGDKDSLNELYRHVLSDGEKQAEETKSRLKDLEIYFRFSVRHGMEKNRSGLGDVQREIIAQTKNYLNDVETEQLVINCVNSLADACGQISLDNLRFTGAPKPLYRAPPIRPRYYIRRNGPLNRLVDAIAGSDHEQRVIVVAGMTGCGKTELVSELLRPSSPVIQTDPLLTLFVDGSSENSIKTDLISHVQLVKGTDGSRFDFKHALNFFQEPNNRRWLIVYDNVDDKDINLHKLLPQCNHGVVVVTTRNQLLGLIASDKAHIQLDVMSEEESIDLILKCAGHQAPSQADQRAAADIANRLGHLPVALAQAGCFIAKAQCSCAYYLDLLSTRLLEVMEPSSGDRQNRSTFAAFSLTYDRLPSAIQDLVNILSFFHYTNIPMAVITRVVTQFDYKDPFSFGERDEIYSFAVQMLRRIRSFTGTWNELSIVEINGILQTYSLVTLTSAPFTQLARMHPLMREWIFTRMNQQQRTICHEAACLTLISCMEAKNLHPYLNVHITSILTRSSVNDIHINNRAALGKLLRVIDNSMESQDVWQSVHANLLNIHGPENLCVATASLELAAAYEGDKLTEMEGLEREAVRVRNKILGPYDLDTLKAMGELSGTLSRQEKLDDALDLKRKVLNGFRGLLKPDHPVLLSTLASLAKLHKKRDNFTEAVAIQIRVLKLQQGRGEMSLDTLQAMWDLAITYYELGRYRETQSHLSKVLEAKRKLLGDSHSETLYAMEWLAVNHQALDHDSEAEELQIEVLKHRTATLGSRHAETLSAMGFLATTYHRRDKYKEAEPLRVQLLQAYREDLGDDHEKTLVAMNDLAVNLFSQSRYTEAEALQVEVLRWRKELHGENCTEVATCRHNLAWTYYELNRLDDAKLLVIKAEKFYEGQQLPDSDPEYQKTTKLIERIDQSLAAQKQTRIMPSASVKAKARMTGRTFPVVLMGLLILWGWFFCTREIPRPRAVRVPNLLSFDPTYKSDVSPVLD